ncbi:MAG: hypothetical protein NVSMB51_21440 [Solirubrobacteraceae bacterium]
MRGALVGQGFRFALAGGSVALLYVGLTTILRAVIGAPFQLALAIGFTVAICAHFTAQRLFVWASDDAYALSVRSQAGRYLVLAAIQYTVTAAATGLLPDALAVDVLPVYLSVTVLWSLANFLLFRTRIFH